MQWCNIKIKCYTPLKTHNLRRTQKLLRSNVIVIQVVLFQMHLFLHQIYLFFFLPIFNFPFKNKYRKPLYSRGRKYEKFYANFWLNWCNNECFWKRTTCNWDNRIFVVGFFYDDRIYFLPHSSRFMTDFRIELFLEFPWNLGYIHKTFLSGTYFNRTCGRL